MEFEKKKAKVVVVYLFDGKERTTESEVEYLFNGEVYAHAVGTVRGINEVGGLIKDLKIEW